MYYDRSTSHLASSVKASSHHELLSDAAVFLNETGTILSATDQAATLLGVNSRELVGTTLWHSLSPFTIAPFHRMLHRAQRTDEPFEVESFIPLTHTWLHLYCEPVGKGFPLNSDGCHLAHTPILMRNASSKSYPPISGWSRAPQIQQPVCKCSASKGRDDSVRFKVNMCPVQRLDVKTNDDRPLSIKESSCQDQKWIDDLLNAEVIGIFCAQGDTIREANETFLHMTGYTREDLHLGRLNWFRMTAPEYRDITQQAQQHLALHAYIAPYKKEYLCKDGSLLPVLVSSVLIQSDSFQTLCFVLDPSTLNAWEHYNYLLLSTGSHTEKTPRTSVKAHMQIIRRQLSRQNASLADPILSWKEKRLQIVIQLVEALVDLNRLQKDTVEYIWEAVNFNDLLQETVKIMQSIQTHHGIILSVPDNPVFLFGDRDRFKQVFLHLIHNAIVYSPGADRVDINMDVVAENVIITVRDQGIRMPRHQYENIFKRFYRATPHHLQFFPDLGVGLSIAFAIIKHYGGTISIESKIGVGSCFQVTLPHNSR